MQSVKGFSQKSFGTLLYSSQVNIRFESHSFHTFTFLVLCAASCRLWKDIIFVIPKYWSPCLSSLPEGVSVWEASILKPRKTKALSRRWESSRMFQRHSKESRCFNWKTFGRVVLDNKTRLVDYTTSPNILFVDFGSSWMFSLYVAFAVYARTTTPFQPSLFSAYSNRKGQSSRVIRVRQRSKCLKSTKLEIISENSVVQQKLGTFNGYWNCFGIDCCAQEGSNSRRESIRTSSRDRSRFANLRRLDQKLQNLNILWDVATKLVTPPQNDGGILDSEISLMAKKNM